MINRILAAAALLGLGLAAACSDGGTSAPKTGPANLTVLAGNNQSAAAGTTVSALVVQVTTASGAPATGYAVTFAVTSGNGTVSPTAAVTDANGQASTELTLGPLAGTVVVTAAVQNTTLTVTFTSTAVGGDSTSCASALTLTPGQVVTDLPGGSICVTAGAAGAQYALIPFFGSTTSDTRASFQVTASGTTNPSLSPTVLAPSLPALSLAPLSGATGPRYHALASFETALRARERASLGPRIAGARAAMQQAAAGGQGRIQGLSADAIPSSVAVGQRLTLNANANEDCTNPQYRVGRVVSISNTAIVVADTGNPSGGYTDAEYASFGAAFDTLINPLDVAAFGQPTDIDHNGRILIFFTKTVNDLTPASNSSSYIGGFFYARDLFPTTSTADFEGCAGSNVGEMFYVMVPDPSRGGAFTKANVQTEVLGTLAHEYQHLINASRRMYVNTTATDFEVVWLNEGLSHIAEELLFYRVSGLSPRKNIDAPTIEASNALVDAFNNYESENIGRYEEYLESPTQYSVYADNDSLATRGATWSFLRYAADHQGTSDGTFFYQLVNSTTTGLDNLANVIGAGYLAEIRDYDTSVLTDDVAGVDAEYQQPSWNFRSLYQALLESSVFPLTTTSLTSGVHTVSLIAGTTSPLRFAVGAGASAIIQWTGAPSSVEMTLVRTQ